MDSIKNSLLRIEYDLGLYYKIPCSGKDIQEYTKMLEDGNPLPENILYIHDDVNGYKFYNCRATNAKSEQLYSVIEKQAKDIHTIKNCVVFFTALSAVGIIAGVVAVARLFI